jgi:hypothetical protein
LLINYFFDNLPQRGLPLGVSHFREFLFHLACLTGPPERVRFNKLTTGSFY